MINCPTQKNQYFELHPKAAAIQPKLLTFQDRAELRKAVALQRQGASLWPRQAGWEENTGEFDLPIWVNYLWLSCMDLIKFKISVFQLPAKKAEPSQGELENNFMFLLK